LGEWGDVSQYHNNGSYIWTSEMYRANKPFAVRDLGYISGDYYDLGAGQSSQTFCRGENLP
ncbi:MAG: hypothetical protein J6583_06430, partial [Gilliamella sp.]|nr:hypothetical protein [Gilliamella sp.]